MNSSATIEAIETPTEHVLNVPRVDCPIIDFRSQNVFEVTWTKNKEPAPAARAISTGSNPIVGATGAKSPAAVIAEIETEPTAMWSTAAIPHTVRRGAALSET